MLTYCLVTKTVPPSERFVRVELMVIPPDDFSQWSETERDRFMLEHAADALARQIGHRPPYLDFDYYLVTDAAAADNGEAA
jgi:hypothetical protein